MKTAMQELINELNLTQIADREKLVMVKYIIEQCLDLEKEQIIKAYNSAIPFKFGEEYYNQTYNL
jgi:hypothetical protein